MVQLAYAIGVAEPVSVLIDTFDTGLVDDEKISEIVRAHFKLTPRGIIETLDLRRPIYKKTAAFGHFGRTEAGVHLGAHRQGEGASQRRGRLGPRPALIAPAMRKASDIDGGRSGRRRFFSARDAAGRAARRGRGRAIRRCRRRTIAGAYHVHTHAIGRRGRPGGDRGRGGARRARVRHPHRPRRRHAAAGSSRVRRRRPVHRRRRDQHERRPLRRARTCGPAPYPLGRSAVGRRRGRRAARRLRLRRPSGFAEARAGVDGLDGADRRHRVAERRQRMAGRVARRRLARVLLDYAAAARTRARVDPRSAGRRRWRDGTR